VVENGPGLGDPNMMFPPYSDKYKEAIAWMLSKTLKIPNAVINAINSVLRLRG
jgi:aldehyde dehydrogenase (NAD+)